MERWQLWRREKNINRVNSKDSKVYFKQQKNLQTRNDQFFNFCVPIEIDGVPKTLLNPRENWANASDYDRSAAKLKSMFVNNFQQFSSINEKVDSVYNRLKND